MPADASPPDARQELDEQTGVTLQIVRRPIVLSRARTDVAANVRDYVTLVAVQQDEAGHYSTWLIAHQWSTVDPRLSNAGWIADGRLVLIADGRELALTPSSAVPGLLRHRDWVFAPKAPASASFVYALDLPTLRYLSAARQLAARFEADPLPVDYLLWADGRSALRDWLSAAVD